MAGIFKKISITGVRDILKAQNFKFEKYKYLYHIDQKDGSDRILFLDSDNDVPFDQEFYKTLCKNYEKNLA